MYTRPPLFYWFNLKLVDEMLHPVKLERLRRLYAEVAELQSDLHVHPPNALLWRKRLEPSGEYAYVLADGLGGAWLVVGHGAYPLCSGMDSGDVTFVQRKRSYFTTENAACQAAESETGFRDESEDAY